MGGVDTLISSPGSPPGQPLDFTISAAILLISVASLGVTLFDRKT